MSEFVPETMQLPASSVLDEEKDAMLILGIKKYAEVAGLAGNEKYIWESVEGKYYFTEDDWDLAQHLTEMYDFDEYGVIYQTKLTKDLPKKFMAFTGLMVRNYIDAQFMNMGLVVRNLLDNEPMTSRFMFVPDFVGLSGSSVVAAPDWKREMILSFLIRRQSENKPVILNCPSLTALKKVYGKDITDFCVSNYATFEEDGE